MRGGIHFINGRSDKLPIQLRTDRGSSLLGAPLSNESGRPAECTLDTVNETSCACHTASRSEPDIPYRTGQQKINEIDKISTYPSIYVSLQTVGGGTQCRSKQVGIEHVRLVQFAKCLPSLRQHLAKSTEKKSETLSSILF